MNEITVQDLPVEIAERLHEHPAGRNKRVRTKIFTDTSDFTAIDYGDIIFVDDRYFLVVAFTKEGRFGIDEQHKPWVPKVMDLASGIKYIIKLVFHETYEVSIGELKVRCFRNPEKEARVLELVHDHPHFMHGKNVLDDAGNLVRILDIIDGNRLDKFVYRKNERHRDYFEIDFPEILKKYLTSVKAISLLHENGLNHGDIRRDHIFVDRTDGLFRWIDFDYDFFIPERPFALDLFGLGSVLLFLMGRKTFRPRDVLNDPDMGEKVLATLGEDDLALLARDRIFNLGKLFPYIPVDLNNILLHFAVGTPVFYDSVNEFYDDLARAAEAL